MEEKNKRKDSIDLAVDEEEKARLEKEERIKKKKKKKKVRHTLASLTLHSSCLVSNID